MKPIKPEHDEQVVNNEDEEQVEERGDDQSDDQDEVSEKNDAEESNSDPVHFLIVTNDEKSFKKVCDLFTQEFVTREDKVRFHQIVPKLAIENIPSPKYEDVKKVIVYQHQTTEKLVTKVKDGINTLLNGADATFITILLPDLNPVGLLAVTSTYNVKVVEKVGTTNCVTVVPDCAIFQNPHFLDINSPKLTSSPFEHLVPLHNNTTSEDGEVIPAPITAFDNLPKVCQDYFKKNFINLFSAMAFRSDGFPLGISVIVNYLQIHKPKKISQEELKDALQKNGISIDIQQALPYLTTKNNPQLYILKAGDFVTPSLQMEVDYDLLKKIQPKAEKISDLLNVEYPVFAYLENTNFNKQAYKERPKGDLTRPQMEAFMTFPTMTNLLEPTRVTAGIWQIAPIVSSFAYTYKEIGMKVKFDPKAQTYHAATAKDLLQIFPLSAEKFTVAGIKENVPIESIFQYFTS